MLWKEIEALPGCTPITPPKSYPQLFLFSTSKDETNWLIGRYRDMTKFATDLRADEELRDFLSANRIRIGLRSTDIAPSNLKRQERCGPTVQGEDHDNDFTSLRINPLAKPVDEETAVPVNRRTDCEDNVKRFWKSQTPQSHHIVEFNNLETLGVSRGVSGAEMDYLQLPAVLLAAEFHQRYISAIIKPAQHLEKEKLRSEIVAVYRDLYLKRSQLFEPMWTISKVILEEAGVKCD